MPWGKGQIPGHGHDVLGNSLPPNLSTEASLEALEPQRELGHRVVEDEDKALTR